MVVSLYTNGKWTDKWIREDRTNTIAKNNIKYLGTEREKKWKISHVNVLVGLT